MNESGAKLETKRILIYVGITFLLTYGYCFLVLYPLLKNDNLQGTVASFVQLMVAAAMLFPTIGVLLTRLITKEGFKNAWIRPHFKGNVKTYLLAYFGPGVLTLLGILVYFLIFPDKFDPNCGYFVTTLEASLEGSGVTLDALSMPASMLLIIQIVQAVLMGPILNFVTCFGEEWGWRGYLLPKMAEKFPTIPMLLINGVIWGLWHAPLTAVGHNYGTGYPGFPVTGILAMCGFCTVIGVFFSYLSMKTQSCIPAVLAHGAMNSIAAVGIYFTEDGGNPFVGPAPTGIVGMIPFIVVAVVICVKYFGKKN